ncbi:Armadillo [Kalmanozyma brasiliensis GHG001]|uniref:SYO1-like TPR repeats domain-containing protein n=1 Tax=Kalmanozyma brasiliensis (strain GHG001) TaxID=1365824 RepID=V5ER12_KALBG|nr:Armadillo [Kalmanozyma brasiliensis GHG001]EST05388.1 Armadillo [Kalmanozyma brasiliensis GHG001]
MPKSGFDPQRHQRKLHRHNPLSKSASASAASSAQASPSSVSSATLDALQQASKTANGSSPNKGGAANEIIPLLANLPAPDNAASTSASINLADKVWSLASVSLLLTVGPTQSASEVKQHRKLLLSHNLVGRLIQALQSHTEVDVRREASGALRNLCVDAGLDVRNEVVNKGGVPAMLSAMRWASNALGFDASSSASASANPSVSFVDDAPTQEQDLESKRALLAKPLVQMNKKEKRHATKLAAALGKTLEQVAGHGLTADDEKKLATSSKNDSGDAMDTSATASVTSRRGEPFLSLDSNTRKGLLEMAENLVTVVWCLCESGDKAFAKLVSWRWLDQDVVGAGTSGDELSGQALASWLSSAIALGSRAASVLSTAGADGSRASSSSAQAASAEALGVLSNEELSLLLDLALASGNALCALTDGGEADFVDGLLSRKSAVPPPKSSKKKGGRAEPPSSAQAPIPTSLDEQPAAATRCLSAIQSALSLLEACVQTDQTGIDKLKRYVLSQATMLGVLSAGIFRNIAAAVDSKAAASSRSKSRKHSGSAVTLTSRHIFIPTSSTASTTNGNGAGAEGVTLKKYEESAILPALTRLLAGVDMTQLAHDLDGRGDVSQAVSLDSSSKDGQDEATLRAKMQGKAEDKAQTLMLALEVLAEMAGSLDSKAEGDAEEEDEDEWLEDLDADEEGHDQDMDMEMGGDEDDDDGEDDEAKDDDDMGLRQAQNGADTFADAVKRSGTLPFEGYAPNLCAVLTASNPSLAGALLTLARPFEASFPSLTSAKPDDKHASGLLRGLHLRSLSVLNNVFLCLAAFSPPPPSQPATDPKVQRRIAAFRTWSQNTPQNGSLNEVWKTLFEIAKGCASVPAVANAGAGLVTPSDGDADGVVGSAGTSAGAGAGQGEGEDGLVMVETCIGTMWSLARILEGSVELSPTTSPSIPVSVANAVSSEIIMALTTGYTSASTDGMRVKCLLLLSTIARSPLIHPTLNAHIGSFLVSILEHIPDHPSSTTSGTTPESMLAAINGIIDTYADETSHYDAAGFRQPNLLARLRATAFKCKALAKQIDRRKQISLRASAEEALENLQGFVQYRQGLRF